MRRLCALWCLIAVAAAGCGQEVRYNPTPQILPQNIRKLALHPIINKTQQPGLEDQLILSVRDEFLRDGRYPLVTETDADGVVFIVISRYLNIPIQYDANLVPTSYKLRVAVDVQFVDKKKPGQALWVEPNIEGIQVYAAPTLAGGMTEFQAQAGVWDTLSRDIVSRVINGFGSVHSTSQRRIQSDAPSTEPVSAPEAPMAPVNPHPY